MGAPRKKRVKAVVKRVSPAVRQTAAAPSARARKVSAARSKATALAGMRDLAALVERVVVIIEEARARVVRTANSEMVLSYWHIGRELVEFVQGRAPHAEYGEQVFEALSVRLQAAVGRGFSVANLRYFRLFYLQYRTRRPERHHEARDEAARKKGASQKRHEARDDLATQGFSSRLSWTHYRTLTKVDDPHARAFYEIEAARERCSVPHLERQLHTQLHLRLLKGRDQVGVMELARLGQTIERSIDLMKSPVVLDFLALPEDSVLRESDLETATISKLTQFLLERGKGFAFVARQKRLTFEDEEFYVDLVLYNIILKCYLPVDLELGKLTHQDFGQMDSYVRLFNTIEAWPWRNAMTMASPPRPSRASRRSPSTTASTATSRARATGSPSRARRRRCGSGSPSSATQSSSPRSRNITSRARSATTAHRRPRRCPTVPPRGAPSSTFPRCTGSCAARLDYLESKCAMTGLRTVELPRASHTNPWAACDLDAERLEVFNGLLLAPHIDAAFDGGWIPVGDDGAVIVSGRLGAEERAILGLSGAVGVSGIVGAHRGYLAWHRARVFEKSRVPAT